MSGDLVSLFEKVGMSSQKAQETAANKKLASTFETLINESKNALEKDKTILPLLYHCASCLKGNTEHVSYLANAIVNKKLLSTDQVTGNAFFNNFEAAVKFTSAAKSIIDEKAFNEACGVGVVISKQDIEKIVSETIGARKEELLEKRYQLVGPLLGSMKEKLRWANSLWVKEELDRQVLELLGPKDDRDDPKKQKKEKKETEKKLSSENLLTNNLTIKERAKSSKFVFEGELARLHKPGGNPQIKPELMEAHLKRTGGKVVTRFPPEPNGFLHIGHAKAINVNFGYAAAHNGITYLRYDDTNPEAEEQVYFDSILETVEWLGYKPFKITYSSDHFQKLYDLAVELIKKDKAYVCHCTAEEMHEMRGGDAKGPRRDSPYRNRPISESLEEFRKMKEGRYEEGKATLRLKMDMQHPNPQFWDLVAYRVMFTAHPRTGDAWCIYPTYDYTHCLCDSFEDITHSLCTTEFVLNRESYYWLVDALELYKPVQWEYGRLKLTNTVLSKRKLMKLVDQKLVDGWDDPRLFTLSAIRRRGFTPEALNAFARELGVTTATTTIPVERLENYVRDHLNEEAPRLMVVLDPLKVVLTNLPDNYVQEVEVPNHPKDVALGSRHLPFSKVLYIDRSDFREVDDPNFYRLAPGKTVGLLHVENPITCDKVVKDANGNITEIHARYENGADAPKAKTYIQWVGSSNKHASPVNVTVRLYSNLFLHPDPSNKEQVPGGWLSDINPNSLEILPNALADIGVLKAKVEDKFQFLRIGYFCMDRDSKDGKIIFNKTVSLKEDNKKDK